MSENKKDLFREIRLASDLELRDGGSGHGTETCYAVEVRAAEGCSKVNNLNEIGWVKDIWSDTRWHRVSFPESVVGVPAGRGYEKFIQHGLYGYPAAQALRWWFLAEQQKRGIGAMDTRLIKMEFKYTHSAKAVQVVDPLLSEERQDIMWDWGKCTPVVAAQVVAVDKEGCNDGTD